MTSVPVTFCHASKEPEREKWSVLSCETIGIPVDFALAVLSPGNAVLDPAHPMFPFILAVPLSFSVVNAIVEDVRKTDTPLAYDMGRTFARGTLVDKSITWKPRPLVEAQWKALQSKFPSVDMATVRRTYLSMHFKRCKGVCKNPLQQEHDILAVISSVEHAMKWFDITASDDPPQKAAFQHKPSRRPNAFVVEDTALPTYKRACLRCSNRSQVDKNFLKCSKCMLARYCSRDCQVLDWKAHKGGECENMANSIYASD